MPRNLVRVLSIPSALPRKDRTVISSSITVATMIFYQQSGVDMKTIKVAVGAGCFLWVFGGLAMLVGLFAIGVVCG